jgi:prepilin-type N-terminal cleavage/methylation domain-containing protein
MSDENRFEDGFTLIELLCAITILGVVLGLTASLFAATTRVFARETLAVELQGDLAGAKNVLLEDLSIAGYSPNPGSLVDDPSDIFTSVTIDGNADAVAFLGDIDSDGATEVICYRRSGAFLERVIQDPGTASNWTNAARLADDVESFDLTFLRADRSLITDPASIEGGEARVVRVELALGAVRGTKISRTIVGEVAIRNCEETDLCN